MARLGLLLVRADLVEENHLARALGIQSFAGGRLGTLLLERGSIDEDSLGRTLALQQSCEYVPWKVLADVSPIVLVALPAKFAIKHAAIPYERGENYLKVALRDPGDLRILDELFFVTGRKIIAGVAPEVRIYQALEKYYGERRTPRYTILAEKLSRPTRVSHARPRTPPPPPEFFPSPPRKIAPPAPAPREEGRSDAAPPNLVEPLIIPSWQIPDEVIGGWAGTVSPGFGAPPEELETITWEEMPSFPSLWLPEPLVLSSPSSGAPDSEPMAPPVELQWMKEADVSAAELEPSASPSFPPPPEPLLLPPQPPPEPLLSSPPAVEAEFPLFLPPVPEPEPPLPTLIPVEEPAAPPQQASVPTVLPEEEAAAAVAAATPAELPALAPPGRGAAPASLLAMPSAADFPEVTSATDRDSIATGALTALARRFLRGAVFVARPDAVTAWGGCGDGISSEGLRNIAIPWKEPSLFLNIRLSRSFYLGPLPPLTRHEAIAAAMGGWPDECLLHPVLIKERPVAFLYAEFARDQGATPMDLAYMRELAAAASSAFAAAIRLKKKEI